MSGAPPRDAAASRPRAISGTYIAIESKRLLGRAPVLFFCLAMPIGFYVLFDLAYGGMAAPDEQGLVNASFMVAMAVYGVAITCATAAASVALERPLGWNRQLRLTPLRPWAYAVCKIGAAAAVSALGILLLYAVGFAWGKAVVPAAWWPASALIVWLTGSVTFAALGLIVALAFRGETGSALAVPLILIFAFTSGVFQIPINNAVFQAAMQFVPMYGINEIAQSGLGDQPPGPAAWINLFAWMGIAAAGAIVLFRRDTARQ